MNNVNDLLRSIYICLNSNIFLRGKNMLSENPVFYRKGNNSNLNFEKIGDFGIKI